MSSGRSLAQLVFVTAGLCAAGCSGKRPVSASAPVANPVPAQPSAIPAGGASKTGSSSEASAKVASAKRGKVAPVPAPVGFTEEGNASWYGNPFHGHRSSNGEVYDMYKLTAAHRTLPFNTMVRVTNLNNGQSTVVRITDRGPFVDGRVIDLSFAAAREIESIGPGIVPVRLEVLGDVNPTAGFFTVQVGAFREHSNAERLREHLQASYSPIFIQQYDAPDGIYYRVRVGRISGEDAAHGLGEQLRAKEGFTPFVVRLDEGTPSGVHQ